MGELAIQVTDCMCPVSQEAEAVGTQGGLLEAVAPRPAKGARPCSGCD